MGEDLATALSNTANVLHYLGKYDECNALILLSRLLRARKVETLQELEALVSREEKA